MTTIGTVYDIFIFQKRIKNNEINKNDNKIINNGRYPKLIKLIFISFDIQLIILTYYNFCLLKIIFVFNVKIINNLKSIINYSK